jgi:sortase (surface protein transpeptidase)
MNPKGVRTRRVWALAAALLLFGAAAPASSAEGPSGQPAVGQSATVRSAALARDGVERPRLGPHPRTGVVLWAEDLFGAERAAVDAVRERAALAEREAAARAAAAAKAAAAKVTTVRATLVRNHFWIPSLGMSRPVYAFPCSRTTAPGNYLYRWGCAGRNNLYLLGHASGVMKPLHDAYVSGRLYVGMLAIYADANGRISRYRVTTWQVVTPDVVAWAVASQPVPSMTLQTCVGAYSQYRLDVRLVRVP